MATKLFYILNTTAVGPNYWGNLQENGSTPAAALTTMGWQVAKVATSTPYFRGRFGAVGRATAASSLTSLDGSGPRKGTGTSITTAGDSFITPVPYTGTFPAGAWTIALHFRAAVVTPVGNPRMRVYASKFNDGSNFREITTSALVGTGNSMSGTGSTYTSTMTWSPAAFTLNNEYLFFQIEWQETTAGTSNSTALGFYTGQTFIATTNFAPLTPITYAWNTADKVSMVLSNSDRTATSNAAGSAGIRSTRTNANGGGKFYTEFVVGTMASGGSYIMGVNSAYGPVNTYSTYNILIIGTGVIQFSGSNVGSIAGGFVAGDVVCLAWDAINEKFYVRKNGGYWNGIASDDPATNTGGLSASSMTAGYETALLFLGLSTNDSCTIRTRLEDFTQPLPTGFKSWMGEVANVPTAWNINDTYLALTLSDGDKTATASSSGTGHAIRSTRKNSSGKFYSEMVYVQWANWPNTGWKETNGAIEPFVGTIFVGSSGNWYLNGSAGAIAVGSQPVDGDVICLAWDTVAKLVWARLNNGSWSGGGDPVLGTGGQSTTAVTGTDFSLCFMSNAPSNAMTLRTEKDEFTQTPPSGFTSWMGESFDTGTRYWRGGSDTWDATAGNKWADSVGGAVGASAPDASHDVFFDATAGTVTITVATGAAIVKSINFTGFTGTLAGTIGLRCTGSLTLVPGMTYTNSGSIGLSGTAAKTLTSASKSINGITFSGGVTTLAGDLTLSNNLVVSSGATLTLNNFNITGGYVSLAASATVNMGSGVWTTHSWSTFWDVNAAAIVNCGTSTIRWTNTGGFASTFNGGGKAYYNFENASTGTGSLTITGANTFNSFDIAKSANDRTVRFTAGTTTTLGELKQSFGTGHILTSATAAQHTLVDTSGNNILAQTTVSYSNGTGGAVWKYGVDGGNNTGWVDALISGTGVLTSQNVTLINPGGISGSVGTGALTALWVAPTSPNLLLNTEEFDNAAWSKANATVTANAIAAPDTTLTADQVFDDTVASGGHAVSMSRPTTAGQPHTLSVYAKANTRGFIRLSLSGGSFYSNFDLNAGTLGLTSGLTSRNIEAVGNGWYRCSITITIAGASVTNTIALMPANQVNPNYAGDGSSVYLWGAQLEQAPAASAYSKPVIAGATSPLVGTGTASWNATGALANTHTNNSQKSEELDGGFYIKNALTAVGNNAVAPNSTTTADTLTATATVTDHYIYQGNGYTSPRGAVPQTSSIYLKAVGTASWVQVAETFGKANFNLATGTLGKSTCAAGIAAVGNGWYRCWLTGTHASTRPFFFFTTVDDVAGGTPPQFGDASFGVQMWGLQTEEGSQPSTYIPTNFDAATVGTPPLLAGVGEVTTPPAIGVGTLTTSIADLDAFGNVRSTGIGVLNTLPVTRTNLIHASEEFEFIGWAKGNASIAVNQANAPNNTQAADALIEDANVAGHYAYMGEATVAGLTYTYSVYAKANTRGFLKCWASGTQHANFNLVAGTVGIVTGAGITAAIAPTSSPGWWRCSVTWTAQSGSVQCYNMMLDGDTVGYTYQGDGVSSLYLWGAQLEQSSVAGSYIRSPSNQQGTAEEVLKGTGVSQVVATGALVAGVTRTNFVTHSQQIDDAAWTKFNCVITADNLAAPDTTITAERIADNATNGFHGAYRDTPVVLAAGVYTYSTYVKAGTQNWVQLQYNGNTTAWANFNVATGALGQKHASATSRIEAVGDGWYRCSITVTEASSVPASECYCWMLPSDVVSASYVGTGSTLYAWGAQLEKSHAPTAYIPTTTSPVTISNAPQLVGVGTSSSRSISAALQSTMLPLQNGVGITSSEGGSDRYPQVVIDGTRTSQVFGSTTGSTKVGQTFISLGYQITSFLVYLSKNGAPTDAVRARVYTVDVNHLPVTLLATSVNITGSSLGTGVTVGRSVTFSAPVPVKPGVEYFVQFERSSSLNATNNYNISCNPDAYASGQYSALIGSTWTPDPARDISSSINFVQGGLPAQAPSITGFGIGPAWVGFGALVPQARAISPIDQGATTHIDFLHGPIGYVQGTGYVGIETLLGAADENFTYNPAWITQWGYDYRWFSPVPPAAIGALQAAFARGDSVVVKFQGRDGAENYNDIEIWHRPADYTYRINIYNNGTTIVADFSSDGLWIDNSFMPYPSEGAINAVGYTIVATTHIDLASNNLSATDTINETDIRPGQPFTLFSFSGWAPIASITTYPAMSQAALQAKTVQVLDRPTEADRLVGSGSVVWLATGVLAPARSVVTGSGFARWTVSGTMPAQNATIVSSGKSLVDGTANLQAPSRTMSGLGSAVTGVGGTGALVPQQPVQSPIDAGALAYIDFLREDPYAYREGEDVSVETLFGTDPNSEAITGTTTGYHPAFITQYGYEARLNTSMVPAFINELKAALFSGKSVIIKLQSNAALTPGYDYINVYTFTSSGGNGPAVEGYEEAPRGFTGKGTNNWWETYDDTWRPQTGLGIVNALGFSIQALDKFDFAANNIISNSRALSASDIPQPLSVAFLTPYWGAITSISVFDTLSLADLKAKTIPVLDPLESQWILKGQGSSWSFGSGVLTQSMTLAGSGLVTATGSGVLPVLTSSILAGTGSVQSFGTGVLTTTANLTGLGLSRWVATGTLPAGAAGLTGPGTARWVATGTLPAGTTLLTSVGTSRSFGTAPLQASVAYVSGFEGVTIVSGMGTLQAQSRLVNGVGGTLASGTGSLVITTPAILATTGTSQSVGTGTLTIATRSILAGAGAGVSVGTGGVPAQAASLTATGGVRWLATGTIPAASTTAVGVGISRSFGTGVLPVQPTAISSIGLALTQGTGTLSAGVAILEGEGNNRASGSGVLAAASRIILGTGDVRYVIPATALAAGVSTIVSSGLSSSRITSAALQSSLATVQGLQGVMIGTGTGDLQAQSRLAVGAGLSRSHGSGILVNEDTSLIADPGVSESFGTGVLPSSSTILEGIGDTKAFGTGVLLSKSTTISPTGISQWLGTGELLARVPGLAGVGATQTLGTGALLRGPSALEAEGFTQSRGSGVLTSGRATIFGTAFLTTGGFGDIVEPDHKLTGAGLSRTIGAGVLVQGRPDFYGDGLTGSVGTSQIVSRRALMLGFGEETNWGSGVLTSRNATISANDLIFGSGALVVTTTSQIAGEGIVQTPVMPEPAPLPGSYPGTTTWGGYGTLSPPELPRNPWWIKDAA